MLQNLGWLTFHPDSKDFKYARAELGLDPKFIGYWYRTQGDGMLDPSHYVDPSWDSSDQAMVVRYLTTGKTLFSWRGVSSCRFKCGTQLRGYRCLTDGYWVWPEDYVHYIQEHGVKPPLAFIQKVKELSSHSPL